MKTKGTQNTEKTNFDSRQSTTTWELGILLSNVYTFLLQSNGGRQAHGALNIASTHVHTTHIHTSHAL